MLDDFDAERTSQILAFLVGLDEETALKAALMAPHMLREELEDGSSFEVVWDSGASHSITHCKEDFHGEIKNPGIIKKLTGLARGLNIKGVGTVAWTFLNADGDPRTIMVPAYYVPGSPVRLMSTAQVLQLNPDESIVLSGNSATLSGVEDDPARRPVIAYVNPASNIPSSTCYRLNDVQHVATALCNFTAAVDPLNVNLSEPEKELLRWHQRLGHLGFNKVQFLTLSASSMFKMPTPDES
jgi:hypothetical protein